MCIRVQMSKCVCVCVQVLCVWVGPVYDWESVCMWECVGIFTRGLLWLVTGCSPALPLHLACMLTREARAALALIAHLLLWAHALCLSLSLSLVQVHTHYRSCAQPAGPALSFALCSRHCWDKRGTEVREERGALAAKVCVSGFILVLFLSAPIVCMSKCVCVCVDSKSLNGISEGLSGSR